MKALCVMIAGLMINSICLYGEVGSTDGKKIIVLGGLPNQGGGAPWPPDLLKNAELIEHLPVDGIVITLSNVEAGSSFFVTALPPVEAFEEDIRSYLSVERGRGPQNHDFIRVNTSNLQADWFDDSVWKDYTRNFRILGQVMAKMGIRGIFLDSEAYHVPSFGYKFQIRRTEYSFLEYCREVQRRGEQLAAALAESVPDAVIMITFGPSSAHREKGESNLLENGMGLMPAFAHGLQLGAPRAAVTDGFEDAYTYRAYDQFKNARAWMTSARANSFPGFDGKTNPVQAGFGIWLRPEHGGENNDLDANNFQNNSHTPEEWTHALHYALLNAERYVWVYAIRWQKLPEVYRQAFLDARKPQALDFKPLVRESERKAPAYIVSTKGRRDAMDQNVFTALRRTHEELFDFPKTWKFHLDPEKKGIDEQWFRVKLDASGWQDIQIGEWWEPQLNRTYLGEAWYRVEFTPPSSWKGKKLLLAFGAVDDDGYVYLNGKLLGTHAYGGDGWNTPFEFPIEKLLKWDQPNQLTVRVANSAGPGGIWKSVKIFASKSSK